ncbi:hypothetical protein BG005_003233 [Podila minutissima]|nr:hypothetical protein BG005_003233 [Podila minutissima]
MNTSRQYNLEQQQLYQQQLQQQQIHAGYGANARPGSTLAHKSHGSIASTNPGGSTSPVPASSLLVPGGRPLPRTPGQKHHSTLDSCPSSYSTSSSGYSNHNSSTQAHDSNNSNSTSGNDVKSATFSKVHTSWVQPKTSSSTPSSHPSQGKKVNTTALGDYLSSNHLGKRTSQHLQLQPPKDTDLDNESYYAALTRPISPTMIMNYIPPPVTTTSSNGRPLSATAALSASFNGLATSTTQPLHQGGKGAYLPTHQKSQEYGSANMMSASTPSGARDQGAKGNSHSSPSVADDPSTSRFARRGPLVGQDSANSTTVADQGYRTTQSRRESVSYNDLASRQLSPSGYRSDNPSTTDSAVLQVAREGWLWRRGNLLTWKRCYAVGRYRADSHPGILTLFKDNEHMFPIKTIDMAECFEVQVKAMDAKASGRFEFKIVTRKEETWFATDTMTERTGWIDALNSLMARAVSASLMNLETKLNTIRHRNNSLEYAQTGSTDKSSLDDQLQLVQQDLASREQLLSQREQDLERKRIESMLVQLEAWRSAAKVTVNQHYAVRDQLLERVMKTARTVQELLERAKMHLETGSDQVLEITKSHLECLKMHTSDPALSAASFKMIKSILVGLTVNLDTRSSEMKRVLLVMEQYVASARGSSGSLSNSSPASPKASPLSLRDRRMSFGGPMGSSHPPPASSSALSVGISVHLLQIREKYKETLDLLEDHSRRLKRILERTDLSSQESMRKFPDEVRETLKGLLKMPNYVFAPCLPDQPLPGAADTFYREDLVQIQQRGHAMIKKGQGLNGLSATVQQAVGEMLAMPANRMPVSSSLENDENDETEKKDPAPLLEKDVTPKTSPPTSMRASQLLSSPTSEKNTPSASDRVSPTPLAESFSTSNLNPSLSLLPLPEPLTSFLLPDTGELTQKLRDTILPEFDHLSIKQEESLQSMTMLLNQVSALVVKQLTEIKESTVAQRQEFEELKDEIIDVMQLSATDPSSAQREVSVLSDIRSKLAEISGQLVKVQNQNQGQIANYGFRKLGSAGGIPSAATATGISLLQRSASAMVHSSLNGPHPFYHTIDSGSRQQLKQPLQPPSFHRSQDSGKESISLTGGVAALSNESGPSGRHPRIAGMARMFEDDDVQVDYGQDQYHQQQVVSKLDQLMLLLEFVNTAQCRMMAYQDLEYDRKVIPGASIDDGRMMAVQEHMEQMDRKLNTQMHLLRRLVGLQRVSSASLVEIDKEETGALVGELLEGDHPEKESQDADAVATVSGNLPDVSDDELTLVEVLDRLDLQVIPSVRDQSERICELSDQLSEMKQQLDEQHRRLEQSQNQHSTTPQLLARSPSQPLQQQSSGGAGDMDANPASWRASLRPSNSVGSAHAGFRDRERERTLNNSQRPLVTSGSSQANIQESFLVSSKTSNRIAEMLEKMDAKMGQVIDEQMARFEKSNKEMLARVYELLEADDEEEIQQQEQGQSKRSLLRESVSGSLAADTLASQRVQALERLVVSQGEQQDQVQRGNEALWSQHTQELKTLLENLAESRTPPQPKGLDSDNTETVSEWEKPLDKIKDLIVFESDRTETNLNDQRNEVLDKLTEVVSTLKESDVTGSMRNGELKEGLAEIREWIVHHSRMQTDNLREIVLSTTTGTHRPTGVGPSSFMDHTASVLELNAIKDSTDLASRPSSTEPLPPKPSEIQELREQLEMFTKVQMATFSELADNVSGVEKMMRDMSRMMGVRRGGTILRKKEADAGRAMLAMEVKETIQEVITRMQPSPSLGHISTTPSTAQKGSGAPLSSPRGSFDEPTTPTKEGGSGLFKYLYQPRRTSSMFTSSTTSVGAGPSSALPPLAAPTTATTTASVTSRVVGGGPRSTASSVLDLEDDYQNDSTDADHHGLFVCRQKSVHSSKQEQESLEWYQDHLELLYKRKILAEIEVEKLTVEKEKLRKEKHELQEEVEQLRREKQELMQGKETPINGLGSAAVSSQWLEQILADRVAMLLKGTGQREGTNQHMDIDGQGGPMDRIEPQSSPQTPSPHPPQ